MPDRSTVLLIDADFRSVFQGKVESKCNEQCAIRFHGSDLSVLVASLRDAELGGAGTGGVASLKTPYSLTGDMSPRTHCPTPDSAINWLDGNLKLPCQMLDKGDNRNT